jgi:hypothetical protein
MMLDRLVKIAALAAAICSIWYLVISERRAKQLDTDMQEFRNKLNERLQDGPEC